MKILLVANGLPPTAFGGVEVYVDQLARELVGRGHQLTIFCRESNTELPDGELQQETRHGVKVYRLVNDFKALNQFRQTFENPRVEQVFDELLDEIDPELVHFHHLIALSSRLPLISVRRAIPTLVTVHDFWPICHRVNLLDWRGQLCGGPRQGGDCFQCILGAFERIPLWVRVTKPLRALVPRHARRRLRRLLGRGDGLPPVVQPPRAVFDERYELFRQGLVSAARLIVPSEFVGQIMVANGYPADRVRVIPLGISAESLQPNDPSPGRRTRGQPLRFAFIGSLLPLKGVDVLIKAFREVKGAASLDIHGRADILPRFSAQLRGLAKRDRRIRLQGAFAPEDRGQVYQSFDVLVIPSVVYETFSLVAREALLMGKPVIAARIGALEEIIQPGVNGFLVEPGRISELARTLQSVVDHPEQLDRLLIPGPVAIVTAGEHAYRIDSIYRELVGADGEDARQAFPRVH